MDLHCKDKTFAEKSRIYLLNTTYTVFAKREKDSDLQPITSSKSNRFCTQGKFEPGMLGSFVIDLHCRDKTYWEINDALELEQMTEPLSYNFVKR